MRRSLPCRPTRSSVPDDHDEACWAEIRAICEPRERAADELLASVKARLPELRELAERIDRGLGAEDLVYRFRHHSFKVYWLQEHTLAMFGTQRSPVQIRAARLNLQRSCAFFHRPAWKHPHLVTRHRVHALLDGDRSGLRFEVVRVGRTHR